VKYIKYGIPRSTIQYIVTNDLTTSKKGGQKVKLTKGDNRRIQTYVKQSYEKNVKSLLTDIIKGMHLNVSKSTVCRSLKCLNFKYKRLPYIFHLTYGMRQKRLQTARAFIKTAISWNKVIFSDEKLFIVHIWDSYCAWLGKNMSPRRIRHVVRSNGLMIWAMIMPNGLLSYRIM